MKLIIHTLSRLYSTIGYCFFVASFKPNNMFSKKTVLLSFLLLSFGIPSLMGQNASLEKKQDFPISVSLTNHSWAFPLSKVFRLNPIHPGLSVGTEFYYLKRERAQLFQTGEIGGFINKNSGSAWYINSNLAFRFTNMWGLMLESGLGLGYFNSYHRSIAYTQETNGNYVEAESKATPSSSINISLAIGYDFSKKRERELTLFMRYHWIASTSYWSIIGIRPSGLLHIGARTNFLKR